MALVNQSHVVALVGCGQWGPNILRDLKALGATVAVVARSPASQERARLGQADFIVDTVNALPKVASVYIATPIGTHADVIDAVLDRGVRSLEKPLADESAAPRICATTRPDRRSCDKWRYHPGVLELARIARSGEHGPVIGVASQRKAGWATRIPTPRRSGCSPRTTSRLDSRFSAMPEVGRSAVLAASRHPVGAMALAGRGGVWLSLEISERSRSVCARSGCSAGTAA